MSLEHQVITIPQGGGMDEGSSPASIEPPKSVIAEGVRVDRSGAYRRRDDLLQLSPAPAAEDDSIAIVPLENEFAVFSNSGGRRYSSEGSTTEVKTSPQLSETEFFQVWKPRGTVLSVNAAYNRVSRTWCVVTCCILDQRSAGPTSQVYVCVLRDDFTFTLPPTPLNVNIRSFPRVFPTPTGFYVTGTSHGYNKNGRNPGATFTTELWAQQVFAETLGSQLFIDFIRIGEWLPHNPFALTAQQEGICVPYDSHAPGDREEALTSTHAVMYYRRLEVEDSDDSTGDLFWGTFNIDSGTVDTVSLESVSVPNKYGFAVYHAGSRLAGFSVRSKNLFSASTSFPGTITTVDGPLMRGPLPLHPPSFWVNPAGTLHLNNYSISRDINDVITGFSSVLGPHHSQTRFLAFRARDRPSLSCCGILGLRRALSQEVGRAPVFAFDVHVVGHGDLPVVGQGAMDVGEFGNYLLSGVLRGLRLAQGSELGSRGDLAPVAPLLRTFALPNSDNTNSIGEWAAVPFSAGSFIRSNKRVGDARHVVLTDESTAWCPVVMASPVGPDSDGTENYHPQYQQTSYDVWQRYGNMWPHSGGGIVALARVRQRDASSSVVSHNRAALLASGDMCSWDGEIPSPLSLPTPTIVSHESTEELGSEVFFRMAAVLCYTDRYGNEFRSPPGYVGDVGVLVDEEFFPGFVRVKGNNDTNNIDIPTKIDFQGNIAQVAFLARSLADQAGRVEVELYRTEPQVSPVDTPFSMVQRSPLLVFPTSSAPLRLSVGVYDKAAGLNFNEYGDWDQVRGKGLYTEEGELPPEEPPITSVIAQAGQYLFAANNEYPMQLWCTKPLVAGRAPEFNRILSLSIPPAAGRIISLGSIDDRLIIFCKNATLELLAQGGPDATGAGAFPEMRYLDRRYPAIHHRGTIETPIGLFYVAKPGLCLVAAGGEVVYVGGPVEETLVPERVKSVAYNPRTQEVTWVQGTHFFDVIEEEGDQDASSVPQGHEVHFDVEHKIWTRSKSPTLCVATWDGTLLRWADGNVLTREQDASETATRITHIPRVKTPWISFGTLQDFKRFRRVGVSIKKAKNGSLPEDLVVRLYYDHEDAAADVYEFDNAAITATNGYLEVRPRRQKCATLSIEIEGTATEARRHWEIEAVSVEVAGKTGLLKMGEASKL